MGIAIPQVITPSKASGAQVIDGSLKFKDVSTNTSTDGTDLQRTPSSSGNMRTHTWSSWIKRTKYSFDQQIFYSGVDANNTAHIRFDSDDTITVFDYTNTFTVNPSRKFRDTGWYHVVVAIDTTQSTSSDRVKIYVNGNLETSFDTSTYPAENLELDFNRGSTGHSIGRNNVNGNNYFCGSLSQVYWIDGQALGPEYFGFTDPLTNTWKPKKFSGNFTQSSANDGTTWSSSISGPVNSSKPLSLLFGGTIGSGYQNGTTPTSGNTLTFDISSKNLTVTNVRLNTFISTGPGGGGTPNTFTLNGTTVPIDDSDGDQTHVVAVNGQLNTIAWSYDSGNGPYVYMRGIEVDLGGGLGYELLTDGANNTGVNSFYLPMDGNSPIGQDQSGHGNDFTPVNFGGSVALDNPIVSGARPILNTTQGGTQATVGVFGSKQNVGYAVTVYNDGGGNKYYIDGVKQDTITGLIRGATYTFDTSDSTVSSHPFRFSATSNGSHGGGSEYTNGVAAITGAATTITVPHDAPETLYYYCTAHSGMGADITGITTNEKLADQYAWKCVLAMPLLSNTGDVSASIACTSTTKTITQNGSPATDDFSANFYHSSMGFDGTDDCLTSSDCGSGATEYTMECWLNTDGFSQDQRPINMSQDLNGNKYLYAEVRTDKKLQIREEQTGSAVSADTVFVANKWHHVAVSYDGVRLRGFVDGVFVVQTSANGSPVALGNNMKMRVGADESNVSSNEFDGRIQDVRVYFGVCKYNATNIGDQAFIPAATSPDILPDTPSGVSGGSKLTKITDGAVSFDGSGDYLMVADNDDFDLGTGDFTFEAFVHQTSSHTNYRYIFSHYDGSNGHWLRIDGDGPGKVQFGAGGTVYINSTTLIVLNKWHHVAVVRVGTTVTLYLDGKSEGTYTLSGDITSTGEFRIGRQGSTNTHYFGGFISNVRINKGTALYTKNFTPPTAPLTNVTNTKLLCCQSPTSATTAAVAPGTITANGDAAATTFNPFNTDINTVRGQETGYATLNPLAKGSSLNLSNGNFTATKSASGYHTVLTTITTPTTGKWFYEVESNVSGNNLVIGIARDDFKVSNLGSYVDVDPNGYIYRASDGNKSNNNSASSYGDSYTSGDVVGVALDLDEGTLTFYKNGVSQGVAFSSLSGSYYFGLSIAGGYEATANFGQKPFKFPPPDGFQPLNTANTRPVNVISRPDQYVGISTWTGDGNTGRNIRTLQFKPDLVWIKQRSATRAHALFDSVRGANKRLQSSSTNAETTHTDQMSAFIDNGFTVEDNNTVNVDSGTYVGWSWRAGGNKNTFNVDDVGYATAAAAGLDGGSITPTGASVGTKQGFSILKYSGASGTKSISHGLSQAPTFIIVKCTAGVASQNWTIYHKDLTTGDYLKFTNDSKIDYPMFNDSTPNSSTIPLGNDDQVSGSSGTYILYAWHDVPGLQKFGKFIGNASVDGPYVELGFKPAVVWIKNSTDGASSDNWACFDNLREGYNVDNDPLYLNKVNAEATTDMIDLLSNGFKIRGTFSSVNGSADNMIYCAWAAAPSVDLYGGGANAR